jgi:hypothetical protein
MSDADGEVITPLMDVNGNRVGFFSIVGDDND